MFNDLSQAAFRPFFLLAGVAAVAGGLSWLAPGEDAVFVHVHLLLFGMGGAAMAGKVIGPSFAAEEVPDVIEAVVDTFRAQRLAGERFIDTVHRIGLPPFKAAADAQRHLTASQTPA